MGEWLTTAEVLALQLPGWPKSVEGVLGKARREGWRSRRRAGAGGGFEWRVSTMPDAVRAAVAEKIMAELPSAAPLQPIESNAAAGAPSVVALPLPVAAAAPVESGAAGALAAAPEAHPELILADWQREAMHARAGVLRLVQRIAQATGCTIDAAFRQIDAALAAGTAEASTVRLFELANTRRRGGAVRITRSTLYRWRSAFSAGGVQALAPDETRHEKLPAWARAALDLWRSPAKPSVRYVAERLPAALAGQDVPAPSYSQLRRFIRQRLGALARADGRMGPRELKTIAPFVRRDTSKLWPGDVYTADGHTFDAEVAHPAHGGPFRPEITSVLDVATRKCVGFSLALDESGFGVLDAQRHAFTTHGVCAIWYVDRGSGYRNALQYDETTGMAARLGYEIKHSLPYNSQARGLEERSHRTIWVEAARKLPTFVAAAMDRERKNKVFKLTRRDVKATGTSRLLMPWDALVPYLQAEVDAYNARPHRGLPKIRDADGRLRHMSPNEAWQQAIDEGWRPHLVSEAEARDLFWPQTIRKVARGEVALFGHRYFAKELAEYHGEPVRVAYDIHDASRVLVRDMSGRLIAEAKLDGNLRDYFSESVLAQAAEKRAAARARRLQVKLDEVAEELAGSRVIEHAPSPRFDWSAVPDLVPAAEVQPESAVSQPAAAAGYPPEGASERESADRPAHERGRAGRTAQVGAEAPALGAVPNDRSAGQRPVFAYFFERYEWLMAPENRAAWTDQDRAFLSIYTASAEYEASRERYEALGIAWGEGEVFKAARGALPGHARL